MQLGKIPRANLAILVAAVLACGVVLGGVAASLRTSDPTPSPAAVSPSPTASPLLSLPAVDIVGEDLDRLPRYPGSVRSGYEIIRDDHFRLTATEYHADATVDDLRTFYQGVIAEHGWERADINFEHGEWSYVLVDGSIEALIEIEEVGGLVEIDLQISEPIAAPTPTATPSPTPTPTPTPTEPPPSPTPTTAPIAPAPPPPPPSDDDDDDDDGGDDGDADGSDDD